MQASTIVLVCHWHERKFIGLFEALCRKMQCIFSVLLVRLRGKKMGSGTFLRLKRPTSGAFEAMFSVVLELVLLRGKKAFQATPTKLLRVAFKIFDEYHPFFFYMGAFPYFWTTSVWPQQNWKRTFTNGFLSPKPGVVTSRTSQSLSSDYKSKSEARLCDYRW